MKGLSLKRKRVLVTGGAGAIGSNLVRRLVQAHDCDVTVVDDFSQGRPLNIRDLLSSRRIRLIKGDVNSGKILNQAFARGFDAVFHLAASFANELSIEDPIRDLECNIKGTLNLLLRSVRCKVKLFVYASSSSLYGPREEIRLNESLFPNPSTPYAVSKLTGEFYCKSIEHLYHMNSIVLRFSNTYGPRDFPGRYRNVIPNFMKSAMQNKPLTITGTGEETRDYTYIDDCIDGVILAAQSEKAYGRIFNLGTGMPTRTIDLARAILKVTGSRSRITYLRPRYFDHIKKRMMDIDRARKTFGYKPMTNIYPGLERTYRWFLAHKKEILSSS